MFGWGKQAQERRAQDEQAERMRLQSLSEKELLIEILIQLKRVNGKCDDIARKIVIWSD